MKISSKDIATKTSVLAIDPGNEQSATLFYEWKGSDYRFVGRACVAPNDEVLEQIRSFEGDAVVIEMIASYGMAVGAEVFETCYWIGRFSQAAHGADRLYRKDIKLHLCGSSRAKDANVRQALIDKFGGKEKAIGKKKNPGPLHGVKSHCWSALAVAVTYAETHSVTPKSMEAQ